MLAFGGDGTGIKTYRGGTHRTVAPDDTVARLRPLMTAFGITRIANLTGLDRTGIPVVMVCRPNARASLAVQFGPPRSRWRAAAFRDSPRST